MGGARQRRSADTYDDDFTPSDEEGYSANTGLVRREHMQVAFRKKEEQLVERALERIRRARALGKPNVKLSPAEIDALNRLEDEQVPQPRPQSVAAPPKAAPKGKKTAATKTKAIDAKKKGSHSSSSSPKIKAIAGRTRGRSTASNRSKKDDKEESAVVPYPALPEDRYNYPQAYYARASAPTSRQQSRANSSQSLRGPPPQPMPPYQHPYYARYWSNPDVMYGPRPPLDGPRQPRPDPTDPDWEPRARSSSSLVNYPLDQLPQQAGQATGKAARFDPSDPRFASPPTRRIVSGPPAAQYRRPNDERSLSEDEQPEVMQYLVSSSNDEEEQEDEDSDDSGEGVQVNVEERPAGGYAIQTRASAATKSSGVGRAGAKKRR